MDEDKELTPTNTEFRFTDEQIVELTKMINYNNSMGSYFESPIKNKDLIALLRRLEAAEKAADEASCLLDHPAFTVGTRSQELLPQGMAARARSAREAVDAWVKVTGKYL